MQALSQLSYTPFHIKPSIHMPCLLRSKNCSTDQSSKNKSDDMPSGTEASQARHGQKFATREQARKAVMDWMAFYNHRRLHSALGYLSPMQYEQRWYEAQRKKAA